MMEPDEWRAALEGGTYVRGSASVLPLQLTPDARERAASIVDELLTRATDAERARVNLLTYEQDRPETHHAQAWPRMQDAVRRLEAVRSQLVTLLEAGMMRNR